MDAGDYLAFLSNGGTFTGAGSVQVLGADIAQAVQVSDDTIVSGYEVADDADLQDLTVDQAVVYTAADNYTPPQPAGPSSPYQTRARRCSRPRTPARRSGSPCLTRSAWSRPAAPR